MSVCTAYIEQVDSNYFHIYSWEPVRIILHLCPQHTYYPPFLIPFLFCHPPYHYLIGMVHGAGPWPWISVDILLFNISILVTLRCTSPGGNPEDAIIWDHGYYVINIRKDISHHLSIWSLLRKLWWAGAIQCISY